MVKNGDILREGKEMTPDEYLADYIRRNYGTKETQGQVIDRYANEMLQVIKPIMRRLAEELKK